MYYVYILKSQIKKWRRDKKDFLIHKYQSDLQTKI